MDDAAPSFVEIRGYRLDAVYGRVPPGVRDEIVGMWLAAGALTPDEARRRVDEVVYTIRAPSGGLAGVNTVYVQDVPGTGSAYYFYRTFVRPADRGVPGLAIGALQAAIAWLRDHPHPRKPLGVVAIVENPKLMKRGPSSRLRRIGLTLVGRDGAGRDVWCIRFDGAVPVAPGGLLKPA
jgi:hypothetical protein